MFIDFAIFALAGITLGYVMRLVQENREDRLDNETN
jgi:hypothetical protein